MIDGVVIFCLGLAAGIALAFYHFRDVLAGQARAIEALEDYIDEHSDREANAEDLWGHG